MSERFFSISFPEGLIKEPVIYSLVKRYDVAPNIYRAEVSADSSWMVTSLNGEDKAIDAAIADLRCRGALAKEGGRELTSMETPPMVRTIRVRLKAPKPEVSRPFINDMIRDQDVVINIRHAHINQEEGVIEMEMSGDLESIDKVIDLVKKRGITVDPIEGNVIE